MIDACSPHHSTPISLIKTASDLHDQLSVRVAHCICHFQSLPFLPAANPTLLSLHERYLKLFENLAHFPLINTNEDEEKFFNLINMFMLQNNDIIGQLSTGCRDAQKYFKSYKIMREFLDNVLEIRLSMRLLAEHYIELHEQQKKNKINDNWRGAICMKFSPAKVVQQCIDDVSSICFDTYSVVPHVQIEDFMHKTLPYFPHVVEYILRELLKNSMRAIVEYHQVLLGNMQNVKTYFEENRQEPLCKVLITSDPDDEHFTIAIQDQGGGIDEANEKIFQYMFTGKEN
jgi:pyruvate dehydrogenase kinase 2/3/4